MKKKVLVTATNYSKYCARAKTLLESEGFEIIENIFGRPMTFDELKVNVSDICGVVAGVDTWNEDVFMLAPNLKVVARFGIGVDNIDLEAAKKYGIKITNARNLNADSVGEYVIALILCTLRNVINLDKSTREGKWERFVGHTLRGKRVGLVGFGAISQYVARLLGAFGTELYAYDIYPDKEAAKRCNVTLTDFDDLIKGCDIVSLHVPCMPETIKFIGEKQFDMMKDTAILINTARGPVVDEKALYKALKERNIAGAGLDVYEVEPTSKDNPLFSLDNVIVMPHTAGDTYETYDSVSLGTAQAIIDVMNCKEPTNWLNK